VSLSVLLSLKTLANCVKSYTEEQNSEIFIIVGDKNSGCLVAQAAEFCMEAPNMCSIIMAAFPSVIQSVFHFIYTKQKSAGNSKLHKVLSVELASCEPSST
jgi:hypothetical protein